jgi:protein-S-isoprenylcysteine O-methyltransferase Ste14
MCWEQAPSEAKRQTKDEMGNVIVKSLLGLAFLMLVLAAAVFLSAGSLGFWQAWVYLGVFLVINLLITAYLIRYDQDLLARRTQVGPVAEPEKHQRLIQIMAGLLFIGLFIVSGLDYRFKWSALPPIVSLLSDCFVALGLLVVFLVFRENSYASSVIEVTNEQRVITSGPYRVVRHPMYAGASLLILFSPLALGSWVGLVLSALLIVAIAIRLLDEEKYLSAHLSGYEAYRQQVHCRLVPFIW